MFRSQKFPVQHRIQCYCQLKNHCFHKCVSSNRKTNGTNFFIKKNITVDKPIHADVFNSVTDTAKLPSSNVFKTIFQNTLEQRNVDALLHRSDTPDDQQISFTSIRRNYEMQSSHKIPTTRQNERVKYPDAHKIPCFGVPDGGVGISTPYKQQQSVSPEVCSRGTFSRNSLSTTSTLRSESQPDHICQIHYSLNDRNRPVPVQQNADGLVQCYICDKLFDIAAKTPGIFRRSAIFDGIVDEPSLILEISSRQVNRLLLRKDLNNLVDIRINFTQTPPYSRALKHQLCQ